MGSSLPHPTAHPRSRGEHAPGAEDSGREIGSSPLTRGAPNVSASNMIMLRLIPAHAGSTYARARANSTSPAHPRSRGEHRIAHPLPACQPGSSPLTRGALAPC